MMCAEDVLKGISPSHRLLSRLVLLPLCAPLPIALVLLFPHAAGVLLRLPEQALSGAIRKECTGSQCL